MALTGGRRRLDRLTGGLRPGRWHGTGTGTGTERHERCRRHLWYVPHDPSSTGYPVIRTAGPAGSVGGGGPGTGP